MATIEDIQPQFNKLIEHAEQYAIKSVELSGRMDSISERVNRLENVSDLLIKETSEISKLANKVETASEIEVAVMKEDTKDACTKIKTLNESFDKFVKEDFANISNKFWRLYGGLAIIGLMGLAMLGGLVYVIAVVIQHSVK